MDVILDWLFPSHAAGKSFRIRQWAYPPLGLVGLSGVGPRLEGAWRVCKNLCTAGSSTEPSLLCQAQCTARYHSVRLAAIDMYRRSVQRAAYMLSAP